MVTRVRGCPHCAQTIHVDARFCHHCGRKVRLSIVDRFIVAGAVIMGVAVAGVMLSIPKGSFTQNSASPVENISAPTADMIEDYAYQAQIVLRVLSECRDQQTAVARVLETGDIYLAYDAAQGGWAVCEQGRRTIDQMAFGAHLQPDIAARMKAGIEDCSTSLFTRGQAMAMIAKGVDGRISPSVVAGVRDKYRIADSLANKCVEAIGEAARDGGLIVDQWPKAQEQGRVDEQPPAATETPENSTIIIYTPSGQNAEPASAPEQGENASAAPVSAQVVITNEQ